MQTVAASDSPVAAPASASDAVPAAVLFDSSAPAEPFLRGSYAKTLGRPRGNPALPDDEWDESATDEERFDALKAAVEEGFRAFDEGRYITIQPGQTRAFLRQIGERVSQRLRAKRAEQTDDQ